MEKKIYNQINELLKHSELNSWTKDIQNVLNDDDSFINAIEGKYFYDCNIADFETFGKLTEYLMEEKFFKVEVIYPHNAMEYLKRFDPTLMESIELFDNSGMDADLCTSWELASQHASNEFLELWLSMEDEIWEIIHPKTEKETVWALFQTDQWKMKASRVLFGVFTSFSDAQYAAEYNMMGEDEIEIVEVELDKYEEI